MHFEGVQGEDRPAPDRQRSPDRRDRGPDGNGAGEGGV